MEQSSRIHCRDINLVNEHLLCIYKITICNGFNRLNFASFWRHDVVIKWKHFPRYWPATRSFDVFFDLRLNKRLNKQSRGWWLRRHRAHCDVIVMALIWCWSRTSNGCGLSLLVKKMTRLSVGCIIAYKFIRTLISDCNSIKHIWLTAQALSATLDAFGADIISCCYFAALYFLSKWRMLHSMIF